MPPKKEKSILLSKTFWGVAVALLAGTNVFQLDEVAQGEMVKEAMVLCGSMVAIWGRLTASTKAKV